MPELNLILKEEPWVPERLNGISPEKRKRYYKELLLSILEKNPNGVALAQLKKVLSCYDERTIAKHLEYLVAVREIYKERLGSFYFYYPNHKILHQKNKAEDIEIGDRLYSFFLLKNNGYEEVYIQEKKKDNLQRTTVTGGLLVPMDDSEKFMINLSMFFRTCKERGDVNERSDNP